MIFPKQGPKVLEKISGGPLTLGRAIESIRKAQKLSQDECAKKLVFRSRISAMSRRVGKRA